MPRFESVRCPLEEISFHNNIILRWHSSRMQKHFLKIRFILQMVTYYGGPIWTVGLTSRSKRQVSFNSQHLQYHKCQGNERRIISDRMWGLKIKAPQVKVERVLRTGGDCRQEEPSSASELEGMETSMSRICSTSTIRSVNVIVAIDATSSYIYYSMTPHAAKKITTLLCTPAAGRKLWKRLAQAGGNKWIWAKLHISTNSIRHLYFI